MKVMGKPIGKLVVDAVTLDAKEEWLQALRLCQEIEMPEDVRSRDKKEATVQAATEGTHDEQGASTVSPIKTIDAKAEGDPIDDYGRARGDPAFGKPLGWTPGDSSSEEDSEEEDSEEEDSDDDSEEVKPTVVMLVANSL
jgi:hypothetical protein